jgi:hypothetical protein
MRSILHASRKNYFPRSFPKPPAVDHVASGTRPNAIFSTLLQSGKWLHDSKEKHTYRIAAAFDTVNNKIRGETTSYDENLVSYRGCCVPASRMRSLPIRGDGAILDLCSRLVSYALARSQIELKYLLYLCVPAEPVVLVTRSQTKVETKGRERGKPQIFHTVFFHHTHLS